MSQNSSSRLVSRPNSVFTAATWGVSEPTDSQDTLPQYRDAGIDVYGVSMDDIDSHAKFVDEERRQPR